ncbi:MAG TPA: DUF4386 domain-containing protein [Ktedonobacterales bacterium]
MSAQGIAAPYAEVGPRTVARMTGVVYLLFFVTAIVGEVFLQQAGVSGIHAASGDAATIARSLTAHSVAFRLGFAFGLVSVALYVAVTALFYRLFAPVSRSAVLMAAFFSLTGMAVQAVASVFQIAPLVIQAGSPYLSVFSAPQTQALELLFLNLNAQALGVGLVFDGLFLLLIGYLIFRSTFLPRMLGAPLALAGLGWLTYLWPPLAASLAPYIQVLGFAAEVALMLWLLIMGVNAQRWAALGCAGWRHRRVRRLNALAV